MPPLCGVCYRPYVEPHECAPPPKQEPELEVIVAELLADSISYRVAERVADRLSFRAVRREVIEKRMRARAARS